jgi:hypothetical protein
MISTALRRSSLPVETMHTAPVSMRRNNEARKNRSAGSCGETVVIGRLAMAKIQDNIGGGCGSVERA